MNRCEKRQKEYHPYLAFYRTAHFLAAHAYFLHNLITLPVIVPFGDLLVINNEHCQKRIYSPSRLLKEEQSRIIIRSLMAASNTWKEVRSSPWRDLCPAEPVELEQHWRLRRRADVKRQRLYLADAGSDLC